jgi:outer membrane protein assembly factor BamB
MSYLCKHDFFASYQLQKHFNNLRENQSRTSHYLKKIKPFNMRKTSLLFTGVILVLILLTAWRVIDKSSSARTVNNIPVDSTNSERDILPDISELNSNDKFAPPSKFRSGHVTTAVLKKNYLEKTADGYCIKLPNPTNVPTPAVVNGTVFLSGGFGSKQYYAFDAINGEKKWGVNLDDDGPSSPAIEDNVIVFNTESCTIFGCDLLTGKLIWSYWLGDPLMSMPTIANGIVFTSYPAFYQGLTAVRIADTSKNKIRPTHVLIAIELKTGKILWQKWIDSDVMSAPVAKDDLLYVTTFSGAFYKVKQKTGDILDAKAIRATSAPVFGFNSGLIISQRSDNEKDSVASETISVSYGAKKNNIYKKRAGYLDKKVQSGSKLKSEALAMDAGNGFSGGAPTNSNWMAAYENIGQSNVSSLQSFQGSRGLYQDGKLYNTMGDEIVCTDSSGKTLWTHKLDGDIKTEGGFMGTPPVYANGYIIVATFTGEVLIMDEKEGKVIKKYEIKNPVRYQPVVEKGWIYVTTINGRMYAINTGNPSITGWNMWGGNAARTNTTVNN